MSDLIECCEKCPNKTISMLFCYNGKSGFDCPSYKADNAVEPSAKPPKDIQNMLQKD